MKKLFGGIMTAMVLTVTAPAQEAATGSTAPKFEFGDGVAGWNFNHGQEFPGGTGSFTAAEVEGVKVGCLTGDFKNGGEYVAIYKNLSANVEIAILRLKVKSTEIRFVGIRLTDSTGQTFQHQLKLENSTGWNELELTAPGTRKAFWGGAKDGVWHGPAKMIGILLDKRSIRSGKEGKLYVRSIELENDK